MTKVDRHQRLVKSGACGVGPRARGAARVPWWNLALVLFLAFSAHGQVSKEYQIKAAFLYNFTKFVEWSPQHFKTGESPIVIGVLAKNPFGEELKKIVQGRKVNGREVVVKTVESTAEAAAVDLLFAALGEEKRLTGNLETIHTAGVLTVGESERFAKLGGIINFTTDADKVRFEINQDTADKAGLKISAQLLKLAAVVRKKP